MTVLKFREVGVVILEHTEGEREAPHEGFEDEGGEEETPCVGAAVGGRETATAGGLRGEGGAADVEFDI